MTESEIEEFERLKRRIRGDWIATIQMELIKLDYCAMLVIFLRLCVKNIT